jgi:uncharacterized protein YggU (UPF0235/DUF167 family)
MQILEKFNTKHMYIRVHVVAGAKRERVTKVNQTEFQIAVREPRERNMANHRVRELIADAFQISVAKVKLLTGHRSSTKMISIDLD